MQGFLDLFHQYAKSELMVLIPVLFVINKFIYNGNEESKHESLIISSVSIVLCGIYTFATVEVSDASSFLKAIFVSLTQGILYAGVSIFGRKFICPPNVNSLPGPNKTDRQGRGCKK